MHEAMEADTVSAASRVAVASASGDEDAHFEFAARFEQLSRDDARLQVEVRGRHLLLLRRGDEVLAIDATCYHMGAPLLHGDVEDVPGHGACITCPWHHYQISMTTGERLYQDMSRKTCTLPKKQRVHETKVRAGDVLVRLSGGGKPPSPPPGTPRPKPHELPKPDWESDRYAFKAPPPSQGKQAPGGSGRGFAPSGRVLRGGIAGSVAGLHPGLRGRGVGEMVARSMRGGDGKAPWAMRPAVPPRVRENDEVLAEGKGEALPSPPSVAAPPSREKEDAPTSAPRGADAERA